MDPFKGTPKPLIENPNPLYRTLMDPLKEPLRIP